LCQSRVAYLGLFLEKEIRALRKDRMLPILMFSLLKTLKQLRAFLRVIGYCRIWILEYADVARPLYQILKEVQKDPQSFIEWDDKSENALHQLKNAL
jgi:predicted LPLAT superfamily acyltransferase